MQRSGCLRWKGGEQERKTGFKGYRFQNLQPLWTWIILNVSLKGGWGERFDHDRWLQKCTKIREGYFGRMFKTIAKSSK